MTVLRVVPTADGSRAREPRVELAVETFGDPADPPLLLLAGAASSMEGWPVGLCERLAAGDGSGGRFVVRYDHRDTGESTSSPVGAPDYGSGALGRDAAGLVRALGIAPAHLVGISMGAGIAQTVALRHPDLVRTLTLMSTTAFGGVDEELPGPDPRVSALLADDRPEPDPADREAVLDRLLEDERGFAGPVGLDEADLRAGYAALLDRTPDVRTAANHWLVVGGDDEDEVDAGPVDVHRIAVPTLVVHGTDDPMFPLPHGRALAAAIPGARLLVVDGLGHQVPPSATWDLVVPAVLELTRP